MKSLSVFLKFGLVYENNPLIVSSLNERLLFNLIPLPKKLFSCTPNWVDAPDVPIPAPAEICPVGFSSTVISIIFSRSFSVFFTSPFTSLKIFVALILLIDF